LVRSVRRTWCTRRALAPALAHRVDLSPLAEAEDMRSRG
jgi:hypothetical protein